MYVTSVGLQSFLKKNVSQFEGGDELCINTGMRWDMAKLKDKTVELGYDLRKQLNLKIADMGVEGSASLKKYILTQVDLEHKYVKTHGGHIRMIKLVSYSKPSEQFESEGLENVQDLIAFCARVSNPSNQMNSETSEKLIKYPIKHAHWPPEMVSACLETQTLHVILHTALLDIEVLHSRV